MLTQICPVSCWPGSASESGLGLQVRALLVRSRQQVLGHLDVLLPALFDALSAPSDRVVLEALSVQVPSYTHEPQPYTTSAHSKIAQVTSHLQRVIHNPSHT